MVREQILITAEQNRRLKERAATTGLSEAELVRSGIDLQLAQGPLAHGLEQQGVWREIVDETVAKLSGAWAERDDLDEMLRRNRRGWKRRRKRVSLL
jgi:hypothetical protein